MKLFWLILKDLRVELRRGFEILASVSFILVSSLLISHASFYTTKELIVPAFWLTVIFIAVFTSTTSFIREIDSKTLYGLRLLPISAYTVFISKTIFTFVLITTQGLLELIFLAVFSGYYGIFDIFAMFIVFSLYISVIASFASALVMYSEGRAFLIPMLIFIFTTPVIMTLLKNDSSLLLLEIVAVSSAVITLSSYILEA